MIKFQVESLVVECLKAWFSHFPDLPGAHNVEYVQRFNILECVLTATSDQITPLLLAQPALRCASTLSAQPFHQLLTV